MTRQAKKGLFIAFCGFTTILVGAGFITAGGTSYIVTGWILEVIGIAVGLYGFGYIVASTSKPG